MVLSWMTEGPAEPPEQAGGGVGWDLIRSGGYLGNNLLDGGGNDELPVIGSTESEEV